jgi:type IV secretion system protein VirB1
MWQIRNGRLLNLKNLIFNLAMLMQVCFPFRRDNAAKSPIQTEATATRRKGNAYAASSPHVVLMDPIAFMALVERCAQPGVPAEPLAAIVREASGFEPLLITTTGHRRNPVVIQASSREEAVQLTTEILLSGGRARVGLAQLDASELEALGLSTAEAFDTCQHVGAVSAVFEQRYTSALQESGDTEKALAATVASFQSTLSGRRAMRERTGEDPIDQAETDTSLTVSPGLGRGPPRWDVYGSGHGSSVLVYGR